MKYDILKRGFTLIEITVVAVVIVIIAVMLIPSLLRMRIRANENSVIHTLTAMQAGLRMYRESHPQYPSDLRPIWDATPSYVAVSGIEEMDDVNFFHQGYQFTYTRFTAQSYEVMAQPIHPDSTGINWYRINENGTIESKEPGGVWRYWGEPNG
jgi:prepilin-type N-terminal cleavage/methylation domain-containing protein